MKILFTVLLSLPAALTSATLFVYDGFADGGDAPGADQYRTSPASTNGTNNSALSGQSPTALGFSAAAWSNIGNVAGTVHPRAIAPGLTYSDGSGNTLITTPGAAEVFRNGTSSDTSFSNQFKQANRATTGIDAPGTSFYVSSLLQFKAGVEGRLEIVAVGAGGDRNHFFGFNTSGNLVAGSLLTGAVSTTSAEVFAADTTHFVAARFFDGGVGNRTVDIWINPGNLAVPGAPDFTFVSNYFEGHTLSAVRFGAHMGNNISNPSFIVDEIRLGSDWDSIAPIPEPATYAVLLGLAGLGLAFLRRRNRC